MRVFGIQFWHALDIKIPQRVVAVLQRKAKLVLQPHWLLVPMLVQQGQWF